jgi:radical SAM protein with 4Fe4S-binding SPASM domain
LFNTIEAGVRVRLIFEQEIAEASAFALDRRNFDYLPDEQAANWRMAFLRARAHPIQSPSKLIVELLNSCNFDCPMCRVGQHGLDLSRTMPLAVFEALLQSLSSVKTVRLNGLGESTLLTNFRQYLSALQRQQVRVEIISNGSGALSDYEAVIETDGHILVSWDAGQPTLFEQLRRPAKWAELTERLRLIADLIRTRRRGRCSLIFTLQKANIGELRGVVELAGRLGLSAVQMNVAKTPTTHWMTDKIENISNDVADAAQIAAAESVDLFTPAQIAGLSIQSGSRTHVASAGCTAPWDEAVIRWNGDVQPCNMFNPYVYGNIHRSPFEEIWRNAFAQVFRQKLNTTEPHPYCRGCVYMPSAYTPCAAK